MSAAPQGAPRVIHKTMAISHADFFRLLPGALSGVAFQVHGTTVVAEDGPRRLEITLSPEGRRRIALLELPVTDVHLTLTGYAPADADALLTRFDRSYQRGGG